MLPLPTNNNLQTYLKTPITLGDAIMPLMPLLVEVDSTEGWATKGIFSVGQEIFTYDNTVAGDATHFWVTRRGFDGTLHEDHAVGDRVELRHISRHSDERNNVWISSAFVVDDVVRAVMAIPPYLRITSVRVDVLEASVGAAQMQLFIGAPDISPSPGLSPASPVSPTHSPARVLGPPEYVELDDVGRWEWQTDIPVGDADGFEPVEICVQWLHGSPAPVGGVVRVELHTVAQEVP